MFLWEQDLYCSMTIIVNETLASTHVFYFKLSLTPRRVCGEWKYNKYIAWKIGVWIEENYCMLIKSLLLKAEPRLSWVVKSAEGRWPGVRSGVTPAIKPLAMENRPSSHGAGVRLAFVCPQISHFLDPGADIPFGRIKAIARVRAGTPFPSSAPSTGPK